MRLAHRVLRAWRLRDGHASYVEPLDGGRAGYQARCWDCDWEGREHLRGDEPLDTPESRAHKQKARMESAVHQRNTKPVDWKRLITEAPE